MPTRFDAKTLAWLTEAKYVKIRAGDAHRFIHVWIVVVDGRVFARSWNNRPTGWFAAFLKEPKGAVDVDGTVVPVRARRVTSEKLLDGVTAAFGKKYTTKANEKYVAGFAEDERRPNTIEFVAVKVSADGEI